MTESLDRLTVLLGRPAELAQPWCQAFRELGARVIHQPALQLDPATPGAAELAALSDVRSTDCSVFSSRPALTHALTLPAISDRLARTVSWAVGTQTARALVEAGAGLVHSPADGAGADALLADPAFPGAQRVFLFAAKGGRKILAETLARRGVEAIDVYVYRRSPAPMDPTAAEALDRAAPPIVVVGSSVAILEQLLALFGDTLKDQYLISLSPRITEAAARFPFAEVIAAQSPDLPSIIQAARLIRDRNAF
ncbi:MAG: uroporphyrinogen-III synthase [Pseudomonadota bacterium]